MSDDIVAWLRESQKDTDFDSDALMYKKAADEIERLRASAQPFIRAGEPVPGVHLRPTDHQWCDYLHNGRICNKCGFAVSASAQVGETEAPERVSGFRTPQGAVRDPHHDGRCFWIISGGKLWHKTDSQSKWTEAKRVSFTPGRIRAIASLLAPVPEATDELEALRGFYAWLRRDHGDTDEAIAFMVDTYLRDRAALALSTETDG